MSVELFRYRGAAPDGGTLEYIFESDEQNVPGDRDQGKNRRDRRKFHDGFLPHSGRRSGITGAADYTGSFLAGGFFRHGQMDRSRCFSPSYYPMVESSHRASRRGYRYSTCHLASEAHVRLQAMEPFPRKQLLSVDKSIRADGSTERPWSMSAFFSLRKIVVMGLYGLAALLTAVSAEAANSVQIKTGSESITLPFNQPLAAWTKIYGTGYHNPETPGYGIAWFLSRIDLVAEFTGPSRFATRVNIAAHEGRKSLSLLDATTVANSLGLRRKQADPNMEGAPLWAGDKFSVRFISLESDQLDQTMIQIWTDQDPEGAIPRDE